MGPASQCHIHVLSPPKIVRLAILTINRETAPKFGIHIVPWARAAASEGRGGVRTRPLMSHDHDETPETDKTRRDGRKEKKIIIDSHSTDNKTAQPASQPATTSTGDRGNKTFLFASSSQKTGVVVTSGRTSFPCLGECLWNKGEPAGIRG